MNEQQHPPAWPMYRALVGIGMLCGLLIAIVFAATEPVIAQNRAEALEAAVFSVLNGAESRVTSLLSTLSNSSRASSDSSHPAWPTMRHSVPRPST